MLEERWKAGGIESEKRSEAGGVKLEDQSDAGRVNLEEQPGVARRRRHTSRQAPNDPHQRHANSPGRGSQIRSSANQYRTQPLPSDTGRVPGLPAYRQPASGEYDPSREPPCRPGDTGRVPGHPVYRQPASDEYDSNRAT
jgi:hypothetical protein